MSLERRIKRLNQLISSNKQTNPLLEQKIAAIEAEFRNMSDEELRKIASGEASDEFIGVSDRELLEIIARES
jgi:hypothetical protein